MSTAEFVRLAHPVRVQEVEGLAVDGVHVSVVQVAGPARVSRKMSDLFKAAEPPEMRINFLGSADA